MEQDVELLRIRVDKMWTDLRGDPYMAAGQGGGLIYDVKQIRDDLQTVAHNQVNIRTQLEDINLKLTTALEDIQPLKDEYNKEQGNKFSRFFSQIAVIITTVAMLSPVLISQFRNEWLVSGAEIIAVLLGLSMIMWLAAYSTKRNGYK